VDEPVAAGPRSALAERFRRFAEVECRGYSPLYERLALAVADDAELLALAAHAPAGQPAPNLFLAAAHWLLHGERDAPAARFYGSLDDAPAPPEGAAGAFRAFCLERADAIRNLLATRRVQTNEVGRCAYLYPAFGVIARLAGGRPLGVIEVGASAGLSLLWDRYGYRYGGGRVHGDPASPVQLACEVRGAPPPLPGRAPPVAMRVGVDLHAIDVADPAEAGWLEALVWPEHGDRRRALRGAIAVARREPPRLVSGDGLDVVPGLLAATPGEVAPCVVHTHTLNQFTAEARGRFAAVLESVGRARELYRLSAEWLGGPRPRLELTAWRGGRAARRLLAECDPHGRWLAWRRQARSRRGGEAVS
jgi:hypothetical protein